jgi:hypothetical protein
VDVLSQDVLETGAGHGILASIGEQFWNPDFTADRQPCTNRGCCFLPQRQAAFLAAFLVDKNTGLRLKYHIPESQQFRDPKATREAMMKHSAVADAVADVRVRGIQDRLHLLGREMFDKPRIRLFRGMARMRWICSSVGGTTCFQMVQEVHDERSVQLFELQL